MNDPELLFPAWRQHCADDALALVERVLSGGSAATQPGLRAAWQQALRDALAGRAPRPADAATAPGDMLSGLALMSDEDISGNILSRRLVQLLDDHADWALRELHARCRTWQWQAEQDGHENAVLLEPATLAETLDQALRQCVPMAQRRTDLMAELTPALLREAPPLYERALEWLREHEVAGALGGARLRPPAGDAVPVSAAIPPAAAPALDIGASRVPALLAHLGSLAGLSPGMRALLTTLSEPVQRSVEADATLAQGADQPLWRFIDRLAALAQFEAPDPTGQRPPLDKRLAPLVDALLRAPQPLQPRHYEQALLHLERLAQASLPEPAQGSAGGEERLERAARRAEMEPIVRSQMIERLRPLDLLPEARQLLLGPWVQVLADGIAGSGADGAQAQRWSALVESLIDAAGMKRRRPLTPAELDVLLLEVGDGLRAADEAPLSGQAPLVGDLRRALAAWPRAAVPERSAAERVAADPLTESATDTAPLDSQLPESDWVHHAELDTVPIALMDQPDSPAAKAREAWLAGLKPGVLCRISLQGRWTTVRLDWVSDRQQFFAFSRRRGSPFSTSRRQLERLRAEGLVTSIQPGQWLRDAADSLPADLG